MGSLLKDVMRNHSLVSERMEDCEAKCLVLTTLGEQANYFWKQFNFENIFISISCAHFSKDDIVLKTNCGGQMAPRRS